MNAEKLKTDILSAVEEYVESTEAWEDAQLAVDTLAGNVELVEAEEAESLPDSVDVYDVMDFVEMTPEGNWIPDADTIAATAEELTKQS